MHVRSFYATATLGLAVCATCCSTASAQTKAPHRTAANAPPQRAANPAPRAAGNAGATTNTAGSATTSPPKNVTPRAPFELTEVQKRLLDQILTKWEQHSDKVKTYSCDFTRWDYDPTFGCQAKENLKSEGEGFIKYKSPDCGEYNIKESKEWQPRKDGDGDFVRKTPAEGLDHWVCDGKSIYELNAVKKQLIERRLPPEMQGKAISEGPLPFVFGAKAEQLKRRYWLRDVTPKEDIGKKIWLEAYPKFQQDQINFQSAIVVLNEADFMPFALRIVMPDATSSGKTRTDYAFKSAKVNSLLPDWSAIVPLKPLTWTKVVEDVPSDTPPSTPPPPADQNQAKRSSTATKRK
jgi:TIGR03009 family protein